MDTFKNLSHSLKPSLCCFVALICITFTNYSQIDISSVGSNEITVNGENGFFDIYLTNNYSSNQENIEVTISFPTGISYVENSLLSSSGHSISAYNSSSNSFTVNDIPPGETAVVSTQIIAGCASIDYQLDGSVFRNDVSILSGSSTFTHTSSPYNILYAALSITGITPKNTTIVSGQTVTRTITIVNGGNGSIDNYLLTNNHSSELSITASSKGTVSGDTIYLTSSDFNDFGDSDGLFEQDETMSFDITYKGISCTDKTISSTITAGWLSSTGLCQNSQTFANTTIDFSEPNLSITTSSELEYCIDESTNHNQSVTVENTGNGVASNIIIDIFKSSGGSYDQDLLSKFDLSSITYSLNGSVPLPVSPTSSSSTSNASNLACLGSNAKGQFILELAQMDPSDVVVFEWIMKTCNLTVCDGPSVGGWAVDVDYNDICAGTAYEKSKTGQSPASVSMSMFTESEPDISDGEEELFTFIVSSYENSFEDGPNSKIEVSVSLPAGLKLAQNSDFNWMSAPSSWTYDSFSYDQASGNVVATYLLPEAFTLSKSEISLLLTADCSMSGASPGTKTIEMDINLIRDTVCTSSTPIPLICDQTVNTVLYCPSGNCNSGGVRNTSFSLQRTSFGLPDSDENGYPDNSGSIDLTKIKTNRVMVGDTFSANLKGVIHTTNSVNQWTNGFAEVTLPVGVNFEAIGATIIHNGVTSSSDSITSTSSGSDKIFTLAMTNVQFDDTDSLEVVLTFQVVGNIGGTATELTSSGKLYTSLSSSPSNSQKNYCNEYLDNITLIGYYYAITKKRNTTVTGCNKTIDQNYYFSVGSCCNNYQGGNLFPYEYRNWTNVATAQLVIPDHYSINSVTLRQYNTRGTNRSMRKTVSGITNDYVSGDTLFYDLSQFFGDGSMVASDDGFSGTLSVNISPTCDIPYNTYQDVHWAFNFNEGEFLTGSTTDWYSIDPDRVKYTPREITLSSTNPMEDGLTKKVTWNLRLKNRVNQSLGYPWVHLISPTGDVQILNIIDQSTGDTINTTGDLYRIPSLSSSETRDLDVVATYSACSPEVLVAYAGYTCNEYPANYEAVGCPHENTQLEVHPKPTQLQVQIDGQTIGDECSSTVEVDLLMASVRLGAVDSLEMVVTIPASQSILSINGQNNYSYPNTATSEPFGDLTLSGNKYTIPVSQLSNYVDENGLPGVTQIGENKIEVSLQFEMQSNFTPGEFLQFSFNSKRVCNEPLPQINLAYDPNISFEETEITGLTTEAGDNWSASWGDYNNDGYDDLFITEYSSAHPNLLFKNNGDKTFTKITTGDIVTDLASSIASSWADYDNDGDLDLFVANNIGSTNFLYQNNGDETFTKISSGHIVNYDGYCHGAAWADYNSDGFVDLFVSDYMPTRINLLYKNLGDGSFQLITSGDIAKVSAHSIGASWADVDDDGDPDLFVPNTEETNYFFRNINGELTLENTSELSQDLYFSTGGSWGDFDNDSDLDLFVANGSNTSNQLFINDGTGLFTASSTIINDEESNTHGSLWTDFDNDGDQDLFITNDNAQANQFYINNGDGTFRTSENDLNKNLENSFGATASDIENDGDLDLFYVNHSGEENVIFENTKGSCANSFCATLVGVNSNSSALGAKVYATSTIYGSVVTQFKEISSQTSGGAGGQNTMKVYFGLGDATQIDLLLIKWPSGIVQQLTNQSSGDCITIYEDSGCSISGYAYLDENENCAKDAGETVLANQIIKIGNRERFTDENGFYQFYLVDGSYVIEGISSNNFISNCDSISLTVNCNGINTYDDNDFGFVPICTAPNISANISTAAFRRGFGSDLFVNVHNSGGAIAENVTLKLTIPSTLTASYASLQWTSADTDTLIWDIGDINPEQTVSIIVRDSVTLDATVGEVVVHKAFLTTDNPNDCDTTNVTYSYSQEIVGAIDPNDKLVEFLDKSSSPYIIQNRFVRYKIRFQNVGTHYASRVIILDTLDAQLDVSTIRNIVSSHNHKFEISSTNDLHILKWIFEDINLPAEEDDEEGSNGFVSFEISTIHNTKVGSSISNTAYIKFDFEDYIKTNEVENNILLNNPKRNAPECEVVIRPNPAKNATNISLVGKTKTHEGTSYNPINFKEVGIITTNGIVVYSFKDIDSVSHKSSLESLLPGIYIVVITDYNGNKYYGKMTKN